MRISSRFAAAVSNCRTDHAALDGYICLECFNRELAALESSIESTDNLFEELTSVQPKEARLAGFNSVPEYIDWLRTFNQQYRAQTQEDLRRMLAATNMLNSQQDEIERLKGLLRATRNRLTRAENKLPVR